MAKGRTKATKLQVWQKEISEADWQKAVLAGDRSVGKSTSLGKCYKIDMANPDYVKYLAEKKAKKVAKVKGIRERAFQHGLNKGKRDGVKEFLKSEKMTKRLTAEFNKGVKSAKPKQNIADRIAAKKAKIAKAAEELAKLEKKAKK